MQETFGFRTGNHTKAVSDIQKGHGGHRPHDSLTTQTEHSFLSLNAAVGSAEASSGLTRPQSSSPFIDQNNQSFLQVIWKIGFFTHTKVLILHGKKLLNHFYSGFAGNTTGFSKFQKIVSVNMMLLAIDGKRQLLDRKSTRLNSSHPTTSRMPSSA